MSQMIITKILNGYEIYDTITDFRVKYYYYTMNEAIQHHIEKFNLTDRKFEKIYNK